MTSKESTITFSEKVMRNVGTRLGRGKKVVTFCQKTKRVHTPNLLSLGKMLERNEEKAAALNQQIQEMIESDTAVLVTDDEFRSWNGNYHFLPMVPVRGKKRWRVYFDAAKSQSGYPAFNQHLFKGSDCFPKYLLSVIIRFRNGALVL